MRKFASTWDSGDAPYPDDEEYIDGVYDEGGEIDDAEFNEALELNKKLRSLLSQGNLATTATVATAGRAGPKAGGSKRKTSQALARERAIDEGNQRLLSNMQNASSCVPRSNTVPPRGSRESSHGVNRRMEASRVDSENLKMADRLENVRGGMAVGKKKDIPVGWTRGIGGRLLPPPKQRWGKKYDAGEWCG